MERLEACLLDYGNTIVEFDRFQITSILERLARVLTQLTGRSTALWQLRPEMDRVCSLPHLGDPPAYRELTPEEQMSFLLGALYGPAAARSPRLVEEASRRLQDFFVESIYLRDGTRAALERLSRRLPVGLVSNYPSGDTIRRSLSRTGIAGLLDPVVVSGDVGFVKPHPEPFQRALARLGVPPERVLFVGDRWDMDMLGAGRLGMRTCHHVGFTSEPEVAARYGEYRPDHVIRRLEDLEAILLGS